MESTFENLTLPMTSVTSGEGVFALPDLYVYTTQIVNVCFVGSAGQWALVDAGIPNSHVEIIATAEDLYGHGASPEAIILTHGHFDHVGSILHLVDHWKAPVYAHELELPYLNGSKDYPPTDPSVDGGLVTEMSRLFPNDGIDLGRHLSPLPPDEHVPGMPGWRWIHTPGHAPGHVSLFRESDRALIAGDAFVTVKQESVYKVFTQQQEINGPPKYWTTDWRAAEQSVRKLQQLRPAVAAAGHGRPMGSEALSAGLEHLVNHFRDIAVPDHGRYVD